MNHRLFVYAVCLYIFAVGNVSAAQTQKIQYGSPSIITGVPHYYEFDSTSTENPSKKYWCGHTALKVVGKYIMGIEKSLSDIDKLFNTGSAKYRNGEICGTQKKCASITDLEAGAKALKSSKPDQGYGGYAASNTTLSKVSSNLEFFRKFQDGVRWGFPGIIPALEKSYDVGHFWVVVGYAEAYKEDPVKKFYTLDVDNSVLYVRDVARLKVNKDYDRIIPVSQLYEGAKNALSNPNNGVQILFVKK